MFQINVFRVVIMMTDVWIFEKLKYIKEHYRGCARRSDTGVPRENGGPSFPDLI